MSKQYLPCEQINPLSGKPSASVILLHGLGADGHDFVDIAEQLNLPENLAVRFVFPHAPVQPITINNGYPMRAWYDIHGFDESSRQDAPGIQASAKLVNDLIRREVESGIPTHKIVLAGFSQGGAMALHCGLRYPEQLAGILSLSAYLPLKDAVAAETCAANKNTPIFIAHGTQDPILPLRWAEEAAKYLQDLNHMVEFRSYPMPHSVCLEEVQDIGEWLHKVLI